MLASSSLAAKNPGTVSEIDVPSDSSSPSSLRANNWNYQFTFNNGEISSGQLYFRANGACIVQQMNPAPAWWLVSWNENGGRFKMLEKGMNGAFCEYTASHYNGKGSGHYFVHPSDTSQDGIFTIVKA